jgi:hypothetical protein
MISTDFETAGGPAGNGKASSLGAADWLCLAAAPIFALMVLVTAVSGGGQPDMLCAMVHDTSALGGMAPMYVLMSAFHCGPWLKLFSRSGSLRP